MNLFLLARRSLWQHRLPTLITAGCSALAAGLVMAIVAIHAQAYRAFTSGSPGYDAVLGARGSALQLVLNAVFHLETSPGNIPWSLYQSISHAPGVKRAVPLALGDNYRGARVVGTTPAFLASYRLQGKPFAAQYEAVVGSATGLPLGSSFHPYHGLAYDASAQHAQEYRVVGVLEPTQSPVDRILLVPLEGLYRMDGHVLRGAGHDYVAHSGEPIPEENLEVSAVLIQLSSPQAGFQLQQSINREGNVATLAFPIGRVVGEIFDKLGWALKLLRWVSYLVMVVAASSILASIYNTLEERRQEFAVMRALGMRRATLFRLLLLESSLIGALGALGGLLVYAAILAVAAHQIRQQTGVSLLFQWDPVLLWCPLATVALAALAGLLPAWRAYRSPVVANL